MDSDTYDFSIVIGRFQPFHNGHKFLIEQAKSKAKTTIIVIGSANQSRDTRNPWTWHERSAMIAISLFPEESNPASAMVKMQQSGYIVVESCDIPYNEQAWVRSIQMIIQNIVLNSKILKPKIALFGHSKDHSSYYLGMFPNWIFEPVKQIVNIDATNIRQEFFQAIVEGKVCFSHKAIHESVSKMLTDFMLSSECRRLVEEWKYLKDYRSKTKFSGVEWDPIFVTVDAVVVQAANVVLVRRKYAPGRGLLALPGGFINPNERIVDAMLRELKEETRIAVNETKLRASIKRSRVYDYPHRSQRGRVISHAYLIELEGDITKHGRLPKTRGEDDAEYATWYPLAALQSSQVFEDHYHIIQDLLGING